jgi:transposase-like protein
MRNALAHVPRRQHQMVAAVIRTASVQENHAEARNQWRETADKLRGRFPKLGELMDQAEEVVRTLLATAPALLMQYSTKEAAACLHEVADVILTDMDEPLR